jgi:multiple sugar transport system permease protein
MATMTTAAPGRHAARRPGWDRGGRRLGRAMIVGPALLLGVLILAPVAYSAVTSLYDWSLTDLGRDLPFVGLANYATLVSDPILLTALRNTGLYVVSAVGVELLLGFVIAAALFDITRGRKLANSLILLPMIVAPVITALLWRYLLDPQFGLVSQLVRGLGRDRGIDFFGSTTWALPALVLVDIWQWTPFVVLILHAGMLGIAEEQLEAARVDGAGRLRILGSIVLPSLLPQVLLVLIFRTMDTYRIFDTVFVLTRGGPGTATETIGLYTYRTGFSFFNMGYAMVLSLFILVTVAIISAAYLRLLRGRRWRP